MQYPSDHCKQYIVRLIIFMLLIIRSLKETEHRVPVAVNFNVTPSQEKNQMIMLTLGICKEVGENSISYGQSLSLSLLFTSYQKNHIILLSFFDIIIYIALLGGKKNAF